MSLRYTGEATMDETAFRDVDTWKDRIEVRLDNRQVFFLFFGSAMVACMLFVLGVIVGKRLESRGRALAPIVEDPLAALDRFGAERGGAVAAPSALTFPRALLGGGSPAAPASHAGRSDRRAEDKKEDRRIDDKKVAEDERAERTERAPAKNPVSARAAVAEPAPMPAAAATVAMQPAVDESVSSNRKLAALPRPLGAPGTAAARSAISAPREVPAPKTLAPPAPRTLAMASPAKEAAPPPASARPASSAPPAAKSITLTGVKPGSSPLAKAGLPSAAPKSPGATPTSPPTRASAPAAPLKAPAVAAAPATGPKASSAAQVPARKGFLLQLSSFQDRSEADAFARRFASENAYVVSTDVPGKGTVYRVRVGSYASLKEAAAAKTTFEQTHNVIAYVAGTGPAQ